MGEDEAATVRTITAYREVMSTLIQKHRGRVLDSPGDNILAEFASVVDAVQCAVTVQKEFKARNAELPENRRMEFRIGINIGDVIEEGERSVALNPNSADNIGIFGMTLYNLGRPEEAIALLEKAKRLNPIPPDWLLESLAAAYRMTGRYEEAIAELNRVLHRNPDYTGAWLNLAAIHISLGQEEKARAAAAEVQRLEPKFSTEKFAKELLFKNKADLERLIDSLRKAGLK